MMAHAIDGSMHPEKNITDERYKKFASDSKLQWNCDRDDCVAPPNLKAIENTVSKLLKKNR